MSHICVCIPCQDQVQTGFAIDLSALVGNWASRHRDIDLHTVAIKSSILPGSRTRIAKQALESGASHLLWLDSDMRFPPNTLERLLARDKDFVAANYTTRRGEIRPVSITPDDKLLLTRQHSTGLEEAMIAGFGVALIKREVFEKLQVPYFCTSYDVEKGIFVGEDVYFCLRMKEAGIPIYIDHDLSKDIRHTGVVDYGHDMVKPDVKINEQMGW